MQDEKKPPVELVYTALIVIQILFGINYIISKIVVEAFPPLLWASIRIVISSVCMLGFALLSRRPHPKCDFSFFGPLIIFALLGTIINQASFLVGLKYTTSTNSAILNTLIPIFTLLIVTLRKQEPVTVRRVLGFISYFRSYVNDLFFKFLGLSSCKINTCCNFYLFTARSGKCCRLVMVS
ncbi:MAG: DMT family transporter [Deltaproteobacteria bacterium]|nr:DMT family transporter [Deltaproteobacteria bacterium]